MSARPAIWHIGGVDVDLRIPLLLRIREEGFDVAGVGSGDSSSFDDAGIPFHRYELEPGVGPMADRRSRAQLVELFRRERPALVHAFDTKPALIVPDAARRCEGVRCVRTITGMGRLFSSDDLKTRVMRLAFRALYRRVAGASDKTIFQNEDDQCYFVETGLVDDRRTLIRGSGVDLAGVRDAATAGIREELEIDDATPVVLMIARVVESKGVREFQAAASAIRQKRAACFVLVGPSDDADPAAAQLARDVAADSNVLYLGKRSDVPRLLAAADVFALPTYYREGLPRVLLESGALRVPMIATGVPGCREVVRHEETGLVVEPRDASGLEAAIVRLLDDAALRARLSEAAEAHVVREFSLERVAHDTVAVYRELLA